MPLRRVVREHFRGELRARLMTRLSTRQYHLRQWSKTFKAYREIALRFERAQVTELQRADGSVHSFAVMRMPSGDQKQLTYDLTARIVDSEELPVNTIIVSTWARTGWNVIRPNVLHASDANVDQRLLPPCLVAHGFAADGPRRRRRAPAGRGGRLRGRRSAPRGRAR
jgi:hypothetical protein